MDVLSNVLQLTSLTPHVLGAREFHAPWRVLIEASDRAAVHIIQRGSCWLVRKDEEPVQLGTGELVLLPHGDAHALASDRELRGRESFEEALPAAQDLAIQLRQGERNGPPESTSVLSASYQFSKEGPQPMTQLPPLIRIPAERVANDAELQMLLRLACHEATHRGTGVERVLPNLIDTLFVYVLRAWLRDEPDGVSGWLSALRDPQISKALALIHERPQDPWTVERLGHAVAMSRAAFAKRFAEQVGEPPLAYVTRWRMELAAKLLRESREPVARIAGKVGYLSETAFAKAFRRGRKMAPGAYRYQRRKPATGTPVAAQ